MAECQECGEEYSDRRAALGYDICLNCGEQVAHQQALEKAKRVAPAYNKGGYQYITSETDVDTLGKKV